LEVQAPSTIMKWVPYGPNAWLLRFAEKLGDETFAQGRAIARELELHPPEGLVEFVPAFTSVLLEFDPRLATAPDLKAVASRLGKVVRAKPTLPKLVEIPVIYDGPDLERVAQAHQLTVTEVIRLHSQTTYKVYLLGFSPGFPYLGDLDERLHTPRLPSPRTRVQAGSVAIGGEHTGIYPVDSPGGWNIIGHTPRKLFDPAAATGDKQSEQAFLLKPGTCVRFAVTRKG
jgi:KipI family sensor histidine kinase inhibitor